MNVVIFTGSRERLGVDTFVMIYAESRTALEWTLLISSRKAWPMEGIGWLIVVIVAIVIFVKIKSEKHRPRCPVCGGYVNEPAIHDKLTGEYYHPEHWLEYAKQEIFNEIKELQKNSPRR